VSQVSGDLGILNVWLIWARVATPQDRLLLGFPLGHRDYVANTVTAGAIGKSLQANCCKAGLRVDLPKTGRQIAGNVCGVDGRGGLFHSAHRIIRVEHDKLQGSAVELLIAPTVAVVEQLADAIPDAGGQGHVAW